MKYTYKNFEVIDFYEKAFGKRPDTFWIISWFLSLPKRKQDQWDYLERQVSAREWLKAIADEAQKKIDARAASNSLRH
jgi:hypothetical protein